MAKNFDDPSHPVVAIFGKLQNLDIDDHAIKLFDALHLPARRPRDRH